jgi:hypothetical protein
MSLIFKPRAPFRRARMPNPEDVPEISKVVGALIALFAVRLPLPRNVSPRSCVNSSASALTTNVFLFLGS